MTTMDKIGYNGKISYNDQISHHKKIVIMTYWPS